MSADAAPAQTPEETSTPNVVVKKKKAKVKLTVGMIGERMARGQKAFEMQVKAAKQKEHRSLMKYRELLLKKMEELKSQRFQQSSAKAIKEIKKKEYEAAVILSDVNARVSFLKKFVNRAAVAYNMKKNHSYKHEEDVNMDTPIVASIVFTNHGFLYALGDSPHCGEPRDGGVWTILAYNLGEVWYIRQQSNGQYLALSAEGNIVCQEVKDETCRWLCQHDGQGAYALHQGKDYLTVTPSTTDAEPVLTMIRGVPSTVIKVTNPCMGSYFSYKLEGGASKTEYFVFNGRRMFSAASPAKLATDVQVDWPVIDIKYVRRCRAGFKLLKIDDVNNDRQFDAGDKTYLYTFAAPPKKIDLWIRIFRSCGVKIRREIA